MGDLVADLTAMKRKLSNTGALTERIGEQVMLPYFANRMTQCGIKDKTGRLRDAVSRRGLNGNIFDADNDGVTVGVDYASRPYFQWVIEGAKKHGIAAKNTDNLVFWWAKKGVRFVGPTVNHPGQRPHPIYRAGRDLDIRIWAFIGRELRP